MENTTLILHPKNLLAPQQLQNLPKLLKNQPNNHLLQPKKPLTTSESTMSPLEPTEDEPFFPDE